MDYICLNVNMINSNLCGLRIFVYILIRKKERKKENFLKMGKKKSLFFIKF